MSITDVIERSRKQFGERVRKRRNELGMSMDELARQMGYSHRSSIQKIESGENSVPQDKIELMALCLKTNVNDLMGWSQTDVSDREFVDIIYATVLDPLDNILPTEKEIEIIRLYREATERDQKLIDNILGEYK